MIKVACDICGQQLKSVANEVIAKRSLGYHKRSVHGIVGITSTAEGKRLLARMRHYRLAGLTDRQIEDREQHYREKMALKANHNPPTVPTAATPAEVPVRLKKPKERTAEPLKLSECPVCGSRFFITKKDSNETDTD